MKKEKSKFIINNRKLIILPIVLFISIPIIYFLVKESRSNNNEEALIEVHDNNGIEWIDKEEFPSEDIDNFYLNQVRISYPKGWSIYVTGEGKANINGKGSGFCINESHEEFLRDLVACVRLEEKGSRSDDDKAYHLGEKTIYKYRDTISGGNWVNSDGTKGERVIYDLGYYYESKNLEYDIEFSCTTTRTEDAGKDLLRDICHKLIKSFEIE